MAEKKKVWWDGVEIPGLVSVKEITLEKSLIEVPSFKRIRQLSSDITKVPAIEMMYEAARDTTTLQFFTDFYLKNQVKDCTIVRTDAHGVEFSRRIAPQCECVKITEPEFDAASPKYASVSVTVIPSELPIPV